MVVKFDNDETYLELDPRGKGYILKKCIHTCSVYGTLRIGNDNKIGFDLRNDLSVLFSDALFRLENNKGEFIYV